MGEINHNEIRSSYFGGKGNQQGTSPAARGHSDVNSINPHEVRIQLIQLPNKVEFVLQCESTWDVLSGFSAQNSSSSKAPGSLTGNQSQGRKILSLSVFPLKL